MNTPLHLDLLNDEERFSSSPIRMRVMLPLTTSFVTLCLLLWWSLLCLRTHSQAQYKEALQQAITSLSPAHSAVLALRAQEQEYRSIVRQLGLYKNARNPYGKMLSNLAEHVTPTIQLTQLSVPPPQPPAADPANLMYGPTNTFEAVTLHLSGRTGGEHPSEAVNTLLATFRTPAFTNVFRTAVIPKGAFRQDVARDPESREILLFDITCDCVPRRFE